MAEFSNPSVKIAQRSEFNGIYRRSDDSRPIDRPCTWKYT